MSHGTIRAVVLVVCAGSIAGMIVSSINDNNGAAITFGLIAAVAVIGLILSTAAAQAQSPPTASVDETAAAELEERVQKLVDGGADEAELRELVKRAVRFGRSHH